MAPHASFIAVTGAENSFKKSLFRDQKQKEQ